MSYDLNVLDPSSFPQDSPAPNLMLQMVRDSLLECKQEADGIRKPDDISVPGPDTDTEGGPALSTTSQSMPEMNVVTGTAPKVNKRPALSYPCDPLPAASRSYRGLPQEDGSSGGIGGDGGSAPGGSSRMGVTKITLNPNQKTITEPLPPFPPNCIVVENGQYRQTQMEPPAPMANMNISVTRNVNVN